MALTPSVMVSHWRVSSKKETEYNLLLKIAVKHVESVVLGARKKTEMPCRRPLLHLGERRQKLGLRW